jgi:hypothetical protein
MPVGLATARQSSKRAGSLDAAARSRAHEASSSGAPKHRSAISNRIQADARSRNGDHVPPQQSIGETIVSSSNKALRPIRFPREQRSFSVGEPDTLAAQPIFEQPILGLQLVAINPTAQDHQQKRQ